MLNLLDQNALVSRLIALRKEGKLWVQEPEHECDKQPLTSEAKGTVNALVMLCLRNNIVPFCSISGQDGSASSDIISLNPSEYDDLITKIAPLAAPTGSTIGKPPESYRDATSTITGSDDTRRRHN
jgi:hypothetical protein